MSTPDAQWCRNRLQELHEAHTQASQVPAVIEGVGALFEQAVLANEFGVAAECAMLLARDYERLMEWERSFDWAEKARNVASTHLGWPAVSLAARTFAEVTYGYASKYPSQDLFERLVSLMDDVATQDGQHDMFNNQADKYGFLSDVELLRARTLQNVDKQESFHRALNWLSKAEALIPQLPEKLQLHYTAENVYKSPTLTTSSTMFRLPWFVFGMLEICLKKLARSEKLH